MRLLQLALASLLLAACGGSADPAQLADSGMQALRSGQYADAERDFSAALEAIGQDTSHPEYKRIRMGLIQARLHDSPDEAAQELLDLHRQLGGAVTDRDFQKVANALGGAGHFTQAIELLKAAKEAFPESPQLDKLGLSLAKQAKAAGDSSATSALAGLGYVGD